MTDPFPLSGRIAILDYGARRIGVAVTDPRQSIASPLSNYTRQSQAADAAWLKRLVNEEDLVGLIVGLPLHISGDESEKSLEARRFATWAKEQTGLPVRLFDERFTTVRADALFAEKGVTRYQKKRRRDMLAAQILLRDYLESPKEDVSSQSLEDNFRP